MTWKIPDSVSSDVEYLHVVPEALRMNDTNADLSGASDTMVVETEGVDKTDGIEEATPDTYPDVRGASDTMVIRTLGVYRNELEEAASDISPVIRR